MDTVHTFRDNITHYTAESVKVLGLRNSATKSSPLPSLGFTHRPQGSSFLGLIFRIL